MGSNPSMGTKASSILARSSRSGEKGWFDSNGAPPARSMMGTARALTSFCGYSSMVRIPVFQTGYEVSITSIRFHIY